MFVSPFVEPDMELVHAAGDFATRHVAPDAETWEVEKSPPVALLRTAAGMFAGLLTPKSEGGLGASFTTAAHVLSEIARADLAFAFSLVVHVNLTSALARSGSPEQKEQYLSKLLSGEFFGAFCLTEPDAGTDAASIATEARARKPGWSIHGRKAWVTNAAFADLLSVYAQTTPEHGADGIATFLVESTSSGIEREPSYDLLGGHAMGAGGFRFANCPVTSGNMLFGAGEGFRAAMRGIDLARVLLSSMCCAILDAGLEAAVDYTSSRSAFGKPVISFQGLQWQLAEVATELEAARLLAFRAAALLDAGQNATVAAAHAKKFATRAAFNGLNEAMQSMGAVGMRRDHPFARHLACAKMAQYLDGTTEVQNIVIGRSLTRQ